MSEQNGANYDALSDARMRTEVQEVELPGFGDGKPWKPKLKRCPCWDWLGAEKSPMNCYRR